MSSSRRALLRGAAAAAALSALPRLGRAAQGVPFYSPDQWNAVMTADPGELDLSIAASAIEGKVPPELFGSTFLVNGPARTVIGGRVAHPFDGHGYVRQLRFGDDGGARLRARFVRTAAFEAESAAGHLVYNGLGTLVQPANFQDGHARANRKAPGERNVANTTLVPWNGELLAGYEGGLPHALDPESLDTLGVRDFGGALSGPFLAHMRVDRAQSRLVGLSPKLGPTTTLTFHELDATGAQVSSRSVEIPGAMAVHDFAITPRWYVLARNTLKLNFGALAKSKLGIGTLIDALSTPDGEPGELLLLPRAAGGALVRVPLSEPMFVVHYANAHEVGDTVVLDACAFPAMFFGEELGYRGPNDSFDPSEGEGRVLQRVKRLEINPSAATAKVRTIGRYAMDFPRIHPDRDGQPAPLVVGAGRADPTRTFPFDSVVALAPGEPDRPERLWTPGAGRFVGEPVIVPRGEEDAWVIVTVYAADGAKVCVLDARDIARGPVAVLPAPAMPYGFHGAWIPAV